MDEVQKEITEAGRIFYMKIDEDEKAAIENFAAQFKIPYSKAEAYWNMGLDQAYTKQLEDTDS